MYALILEVHALYLPGNKSRLQNSNKYNFYVKQCTLQWSGKLFPKILLKPSFW